MVKVFNVDEMTSFNDGMASIQLYGCIGYINNRFEVVIEPQYGISSSGFNEGLASVCTPKKYGKELYGYINKKGEKIIKHKFDLANNFSEGLAVVYIDGKVGAIDKSGKIVIQAKYDWVNDFKEGRAFLKKDDLWGIVDNKGNEILEPILEEDEDKFDFYECQDFSQGLARILKDKKYGYIDINGNMVTDAIYEDATPLSEGLVSVKLNKTWFVKDKFFKTLIELNCDSVGSFKSGMASISVNGKYGYINKKGEIVVKPKYDSVTEVNNDIATVILDGKIGYINKTGDEIFIENEVIKGKYYYYFR